MDDDRSASEDELDPARDLGALAARLEDVARLLDEPQERLLARAEGVSGWSAGEHAFHLILACDLSLGNAAALVADRGRLVREPVDRKDEALAILRAGAIPRGQAQAPRFVTPPERPDLELARRLLADAREAIAALARDPQALRAAPRTVPHQLLGDLTAVEWVRFARVHTDHHLAIVDDVRAALAGGAAPGPAVP